MERPRLLIRKRLIRTLLGLALGTTACFAQSAPDLADVSLEQLGNIKVYAASRHFQATSDAPASVTVVTRDDIQRYGYRTLADVLQSARGFFTTYDRNYRSLGVRGSARPGDFNTRILLLANGHRLNDNIYDEAMLGTEFPIDLDLIERIEIIRGPASSLYGSNALLAVINIITRSAQALHGWELSAQAESFDTYAGRISYGTSLRNVEFAISQSFYGARGHKQLFFSDFNTPQTNNGIANHGDDDQVSRTFATISSRGFRLESIYGSREKGIPTAPYETVFNTSGTRTTDTHGYLDLSYQHTFAQNWDVLARIFYDRYTYQGTYMYSSEGDSAKVWPNLDYGDGKWWGTELQVGKTILTHHHVIAGGEYRDNLRQNQTNYSIDPYEFFLEEQHNSFVGALYLQDEWKVARSLTLNAGFRYDYYNRLDSSLDPRAALIYSPWTSAALKFMYGEAFRAPNVYELYYSIAPMLPNPQLRPERISNLEFVWEQGIGTHLWFTSSAFHDHMSRLITEEPTAEDELIFQNVQDVTSNGMEWEARSQLTGGFEGTASYSFQRSRDTVTDQPLSNSPQHLLKLNVSQPVLKRKVLFSVDGQYRSGMQGLDSSWVSPFVVFNATLLARRVAGQLDVSLSVYNLLDRKYCDPPSVANLALPIEQDGRSVRVKMTWHIGGR
jgi:outer membrane receptor for ferrienterochelin and colicins